MIVISDEERKDFNEEEFDPTKEAFFSDLNNMEEEIASEAYELVEHALGLLNDGYYDDSIEVLRQAAGLYAQINKSAEVEAINNKISEIYLLKEKSFSEQFVSEELIEEKSIEYNAEDLIEEALQLADIDEYDEALERLEEAYRIYESENNESEIEIVKKYIDDIKIKKEKSELGEISEASEKEIEKEEILDAKVKEGYELMNKASDLVKEKKYEEALTLYNKAYKIFEDLDKKPELQELDNLIAYAKREKAILSEEIGKREVPEISKPIILEPSLTAKDEAYKEEKLKRIKEFEAKKKEEEEFQEYIRKTVDDAEAKAREYDLAIRKGNFDIECPYPEIIKTYTHICDLLREKGWNDQVQIYQRQVQLYTEKLEKDKKLREIEAQKKQKQLEYEALLKRSTETEIESKTTEAISGEIPKEHKETLELEKFEEQIDNMINEAERLAREYEFQIKKGKFEIECIYPKVIEIYEKIRDMVLEKGWEEEAKIYLTQIRKYKEKLERDKKIRELEEEKKRKQEEFKAFKTIKTGSIGLSAEKLKKLEEIQKLKEEEDNLRNRIDEMVKQAERMAREYELKIRKGHFEEECVYPEIIKIFEEIIKLVSEKGWQDEEAIYRTQIRKYKELLEKDKRLRELERKKLEKQKMYEEMQKVSRPTTLKEIKIAAKQAADKKEEELVDKAFKLMDEAEKLVKNYELKLKKEILLYDSPYEKAIELYQEAKELLKEAGWTSEAAKINHSIKLYKEKKIKDDKVRELERQKLKEKEETERIKKAEIEESSTLREQRIQELEAEKKKKEAIAESIFEIINEAERIVKDYEMSLKGGGILNYECPYEKIIDMYREARKRFEEIGWKEEASKLINSIKYYKDKLEKDKKLREVELKKQEKERLYQEALKQEVKVEKPLEEMKRQELDKLRKKEEDLSNEAFAIIDEAERMAKDYELAIKTENVLNLEPPYEKIIEKYRKAREKFKEIGWIDQAENLISTIKYYKDKLEADKRLRKVELEKLKKEKEFLEAQKIATQKVKKEDISKAKLKKTELLEKDEETEKREKLKNEAFALMDRAKYKFSQNKFDEAIKLYEESEEIFKQIDWHDGIKMIRESIALIRSKKKQFEEKLKAIEMKKAKQKELEKKLEEKLTKVLDERKSLEAKRRRELLLKQKQKEAEKTKADEAFKLLELGTSLMNKQKFNEAYEKYCQARDIFKEIGWHQEVRRINSDLLYKLKLEEKKVEKLKKYREKKLQEKKQLQELLKSVELKSRKSRESEVSKRRELLKKLKSEGERPKKFTDLWDKANELIEDNKFNEAIILLKKVKKIAEKSDKKEEIKEIDKQISEMIASCPVPLITNEEIVESKNIEAFEAAYKALDRAQNSIANNRYMKAISELMEAKHNLNDTSDFKKYIKDIESLAEKLKERLKKKKVRKVKTEEKVDIKSAEIEEKLEISGDKAYEYMDKANKEERKNNFDKAIEYASRAAEIFKQLGPEWSRELTAVNQHIIILKNKRDARKKLFELAKKEREKEQELIEMRKKEEEELKARIAARRAERRRRIAELMKKKEEK